MQSSHYYFTKTDGEIWGKVDLIGGFYENRIKLIKLDEYGIDHQNLSLTKVSNNLNEQNASFFW